MGLQVLAEQMQLVLPRGEEGDVRIDAVKFGAPGVGELERGVALAVDQHVRLLVILVEPEEGLDVDLQPLVEEPVARAQLVRQQLLGRVGLCLHGSRR